MDSVPSDNNCVSWSGSGTGIVQVSGPILTPYFITFNTDYLFVLFIVHINLLWL